MPRTENLLADALRRSIRYLEGARTRRVSPAQADVERLAELGGSLPEQPVDAQRTLALSLLGLGAERVVRVPCDRQGRMQAGKLPALSSSTIVCIQAGNVNTDRRAQVAQRAV